MSKRGSLFCSTMTAQRAVLALLLAILATGFAVAPAKAGNTAVRISEVDLGLPGHYADVHITLDNSASLRGFGGFDLLIAYDASALTLQEAIPGPLIGTCGWEYFTYRFGGDGNCSGPCPTGLVRLVAVAETNNGDIHPSCFFSGVSGVVSTLNFLVASDSIYNCLFYPISFYWLDCGDNTLSSISGDTLYVSHRVYNSFFHNDVTGQPGYGGWQGIEGSPDCLNHLGSQPDTAVDFYNGGVDIVCIEPINARGDLNLNGIANEIADQVIFTQYFFEGLSAFGNRVQESVAASDVNADGKVLTYQDLVYLTRIIIGDALPFPKRAVGASVDAYFQQDSTNHKVVVNCSVPLAGAFMLIRGNVTPTFLIQGVWSEQAFYDGTYTRILILGSPEHPYGNGVWFTYQGTGKLEYVETTDWHNTSITAHITHQAINCGDFDGSGSINIADAIYVIRYVFSGGFLPVDIHGGDVNCDNTCNISDIVYLLAYIFSGGPAPCENCK